ncbi:unnamed protein product [Arabis nemorensis]|uniref:Uncharacterized protein n=1 Tax=Arabis nemorensis TaxID=586526 RepID=A0A565AZG3_9BRAS|nr:unnamed protein product [Arabis nemorensis]
MSHFKGCSRLPEFAVPKKYNLRLSPDLTAGDFAGTVAIDVDIVTATRFIVLNAVDLSVNNASVSFTPRNSSEVSLLRIHEFDDDEIVFEADARRCFPCWDEPAWKATFQITVVVPNNVVALSNMPVVEEKIDRNLKIVSYQETPMMSTYLVAIVVGLFDYVEDHTCDGIKVRVYCQVGKADQGKFALHVAAKTLDLFKEYLALPYPLPKLDMVAIPDAAAGAMESYGLVTYPETALLYDEQRSAASNKLTREEPLLNTPTVSGNAGNNVDSNPFSALHGDQVQQVMTLQQSLSIRNRNTISLASSEDPMVGATPDASQMNQLLQILGLHSNPQYTNQIISLNPELQSVTLKPGFLRLLNSPEAMQHMMTLQQSLFSGYWNTTSQAREQTGATTGTQGEMEICANYVVMKRETGAIGVVSSDRLSLYPIDKEKSEDFDKDKLVLVSRRVSHGKIVCSVMEKKKVGYILKTDTKVDLAASHGGDIIHRDIGTESMERIRCLFVGDFVIYESWVGIVEEVELDLKVKFDDGIVRT